MAVKFKYSDFTREQYDLLKDQKLKVPCDTWNKKDAAKYFGRDYKKKKTPAYIKKITHFQKTARFEVNFPEIDSEFYVDLDYVMKYASSLPAPFRKGGKNKRKVPSPTKQNQKAEIKNSSGKNSKRKLSKASEADEVKIGQTRKSKKANIAKRMKQEIAPLFDKDEKNQDDVSLETNGSSTCEHPLCKNLAMFNFEGENSGIYCPKHKLDAMIDVMDYLPVLSDTFKPEVSHQTICEIQGCTRTALYNYKGKNLGKFCFEHKLKPMAKVEMKRTCQFPSCDKSAVYTYQASQSFYCSFHQIQSKRTFKEAISPTKNMSKICNHDRGTNPASLNVKGKGKAGGYSSRRKKRGVQKLL